MASHCLYTHRQQKSKKQREEREERAGQEGGRPFGAIRGTPTHRGPAPSQSGPQLPKPLALTTRLFRSTNEVEPTRTQSRSLLPVEDFQQARQHWTLELDLLIQALAGMGNQGLHPPCAVVVEGL